MNGEVRQNGNGYEHAGGYQPDTALSPSWRDLLVAVCNAVALIAVTTLYNDYLEGQNRHFLGLALGLGMLVLSPWTVFAPRRPWQDWDVKRRALFFLFTILLFGFIAYAFYALRDAGGWA